MILRVLLADDQTLLREAFRTLLDSAGDITVVGDAADGREAVRLIRELRPDVVVMDIRMPEMDGLTSAAQIRADPKPRGSRVLVLTTCETDETMLSPAATRAVVDGFLSTRGCSPSRDPGQLAELTRREGEMVALVATGLSHQEIAELMLISPFTVRAHVQRAMTKLQAVIVRSSSSSPTRQACTPRQTTAPIACHSPGPVSSAAPCRVCVRGVGRDADWGTAIRIVGAIAAVRDRGGGSTRSARADRGRVRFGQRPQGFDLR